MSLPQTQTSFNKISWNCRDFVEISFSFYWYIRYCCVFSRAVILSPRLLGDPACSVRVPVSDLLTHRPALRWVSQPAAAALDVRPASNHLLQVTFTFTVPVVVFTADGKKKQNKYVQLFSEICQKVTLHFFVSDLKCLSDSKTNIQEDFWWIYLL